MKSHSSKKSLLLVVTSLTAAFVLAGCRITTSADSTGAVSSAAVSSVPASSVAASSVAPAATAHKITIEAAEGMKIIADKTEAEKGEKVGLTVIVSSGHLVAPTVTVGKTVCTLSVINGNPGVFSTGFTMPDSDVTVVGTIDPIIHTVTATVPENVYGFFYDPTAGDWLKDDTGNYITEIDNAHYGDIYFFQPLETKVYAATAKMVKGITVNGDDAVSAGENDYGEYYAIPVFDLNIKIKVVETDRTYLSIGYSKNTHVAIGFKTLAGGILTYNRALSGAKVTFTAKPDSGYGLLSIFAYDTVAQAPIADFAYDVAAGTYSYTQPAAQVYIVASTEATSYPIYVGTKDTYGFSISSSMTVNGATLSGSEPKIAKAGDVVTFDTYDVSDAQKFTKVMVNGVALTPTTAEDDNGKSTYTFTMPACEAKITYEIAYDNHAITVVNAAHFTATTHIINTDKTTTDVTEAYAGEKVYLTTAEVASTDGKSYVMQTPVVTYKTSDTASDSKLTVTKDTTTGEYYFTMPKYAVTVTMVEKEAIWKGKSFVGTYYGGKNGGTNYKIQFTEDGSIYWDTNATAFSDITMTENTDGTATCTLTRSGYYTYTDAITIKGNNVFIKETEDDDSTVGLYFYTKTGAAKPTSAGYAYTSAKDAYVFGITPTKGANEYAFYDGTNVIIGATVTILSGAAWNDSGAKIMVKNGDTLLGVYTVSGSYTKTLTAVAVGAEAGTYKLADGTKPIVLDGYGLATYDGVAGTYTISGTTVTIVTSVTADGSTTVTTSVVEIDTTAKTYTVTSSTPIILPAFAGKAYSGSFSYYNDSNNKKTDGVCKITFGATAQTVTVYCSAPNYNTGWGSADVTKTYSNVAYTYDATAKKVSVTLNSLPVSFTYDDTANTFTVNADIDSGSTDLDTFSTGNIVLSLAA
jgi:hypothetical protein